MTRLLKALSVIADSEDLTDFDKVRAAALMTGYDRHWGEQQWDTVAVEKDVLFEIPQTAWTYAGKIDTLATGSKYYGSALVMIEHKTTTQDLSKKTAVYFSKLSYDEQISRYHLAQWLMEDPLDQTIYDVIRKITTKPKRLTKADKVEIEGGTYNGVELPSEDIEETLELEREDVRLYQLRVRREVLDNPEKYFLRKGNIQRSTEQMVETLAVLQQIVVDIDNAEAYNHWYQNTQACNMYNSACEYLPLCMGISDPGSDTWVERTGSSISGPRVLSHSRASCFQLCRRKYYWRYVEGIKRDEASSPALTFGSAIHQALEAWWMTDSSKEKEDE